MKRRVLLTWLLPAAALLAGNAAPGDTPEEHLSGWWEAERTVPPSLALLQDPPPMKPAQLAAMNEALSDLLYRGDRHIEYCRPRQFVGFQNGEGFEDIIELLFTQGRVTLTNEQGLLRRILMDVQVAADELPETRTGISVGRWDGDVLVVETTGLSSTSRFPLPVEGAPQLGPGARVTERIALLEEDLLEIRSTLIAPELFDAPFEITTRYRRLPDHLPFERSECPDNDRLIDPATGATRFELTPPEGLKSED